jgi:hypothetical protein
VHFFKQVVKLTESEKISKRRRVLLRAILRLRPVMSAEARNERAEWRHPLLNAPFLERFF